MAHIFGVPCLLNIDIVFDVPTGQGTVQLEREVLWPGTPQVGHTLAHTNMLWPVEAVIKVETVGFELDVEAEVICRVTFERWHMSRDLITQGASGMLWAKYTPFPEDNAANAVDIASTMTKQGFIDYVSTLIRYGWDLLHHYAMWAPKDGTPEMLQHDVFPDFNPNTGEYE